MSLGSLPVSTRKNDNDATGLRGTIIGVVRNASNNAPRSLQKSIGPSQVGTPCDRQLAYEMDGTAPNREAYSDPWPSIVGTATHAWLDKAFTADNARLVAEGKVPRWHLERRVHVGFGLQGSCDCFDELTGTVLDWKILGNTTYAKYTKEGPSETYRVQAHCYGLGYVQAGFDVKKVGIGFFGRAKRLNDLHIWSEDFDINIALRALARMRNVQTLLDNGGNPRMLKATPGAACFFCNFRSCNEGEDGFCRAEDEA